MPNYQRQLDLPNLLKKKSFFLLGPRATGKSSLIKNQLGDKAFVINLLQSDFYLRLSARPWELESIIAAAINKNGFDIIAIDEIQKVPHLLDEVHRLIEEKKMALFINRQQCSKVKTWAFEFISRKSMDSESSSSKLL